MQDTECIEIGKIVNTHGLKGEMKVTSWCDSPDVFHRFHTVYLQDGTAYTVTSVRFQKDTVLLKLKGIETIEAAQAFRNKVLCAKQSDIELEEGTYFVKDLIGLSVLNEDGEHLGVLSDVFPAGGRDVYVVKRPGKKELLLPAIKEVVKTIALEKGKMVVHLLEGLLPEEP